MQGSIIHRVLAEWLVKRGRIEPLFDDIFNQVAAKESIPTGYRTEVYRTEMRNDLRRFAEDKQWPAIFQSAAEQEFKFELEDGFVIKGRIDRLDQTPEGLGFVIDYKYSKNFKEKLTDPKLLQGPLYLMAAERAFGQVKYVGWSQAVMDLKPEPERFTPDWLNAAQVRSIAAAQQIIAGHTAPAPYDLSKCDYCAYRDVCRYDAQAGAQTSEGA